MRKTSPITIMVASLVIFGLASSCRALTTPGSEGALQSPDAGAVTAPVPETPPSSPNTGEPSVPGTETPSASASQAAPDAGPKQPIEPEPPQQSIDYYNEAVRLNPDDADVYINRGLAYQNLGKFYRAIADYRKAISLSPKNCVAHRLRGTVYRDARWFQKAFADFDRAILINPQYARAYYDRALGYSMAGQFGQAITDYDESIRLDPQYAKTYGLRAIAYDYLGQSQRAIDDYSEAIRLEPTAFLYAARGRVYEIQGRNTEALADFEKVIAITDDQSLANEARQQIETMASSSPPVTTPSSNPLTEHQVVTRDIVANKATFDQDTITVPATAVVLLAFQNHDNVAYNFSIYDDSTTSSLIFRGVSNIGPSRHMYQFTAPATPGIYYFRCDEYPASMNGSLIVVTPNS